MKIIKISGKVSEEIQAPLYLEPPLCVETQSELKTGRPMTETLLVQSP